MPRKLTATTGVVLALLFAGCGKDSPSGTAAKTTTPAAVPTATSDATPTTTTTTSKAAAKKSAAKKAAAKKKTSAAKTTTATTAKGSAKATATAGARKKKTAATAKKPAKTQTTRTTPTPAVTPSPNGDSPSTADSTSGSGSGPTSERLEVVTVLRRYYKAFLDKDGAEACGLLTAAGRAEMVLDGRGKTCPDSVKRLVSSLSAANVKLLEATRDNLHVNDVTITGATATAQIGKKSQLRMSREDGHWLVRSPNVVNS